MKIVVLVGDGMGDYPLDALGGRTPLQAARIPNIRRAAAAGRVCQVKTVPEGMAPGSDVANLSLLGFDPRAHYGGRAPLEAVGLGLNLGPADAAFRCNLVTVEGDILLDYSAGHIGTDEAAGLIETLNAKLAGGGMRFHVGVSYRHLLVWPGGPVELQTVPPHDIQSRPVGLHLPRGEREAQVRDLMARSIPLFARHAVNLARTAAGKRPATQIWLWGQGRAVALPTYAELYGLHGSVISAVDLVRGTGRLAGLTPVCVPGATGFIDTNYEGKVRAALDALSQGGFVFVHVEAPDECGHLGDAPLKIRAIEAFDERIVGPVWRGLQARGEPYRLLVCTDHRTPIAVRSHTPEPVPMLILDGPTAESDREAPFDEFAGDQANCRMAFDVIRDVLQGKVQP